MAVKFVRRRLEQRHDYLRVRPGRPSRYDALPNGVQLVSSYDDANRLVELTHTAVDSSLMASFTTSWTASATASPPQYNDRKGGEIDLVVSVGQLAHLILTRRGERKCAPLSTSATGCAQVKCILSWEEVTTKPLYRLVQFAAIVASISRVNWTNLGSFR